MSCFHDQEGVVDVLGIEQIPVVEDELVHGLVRLFVPFILSVRVVVAGQAHALSASLLLSQVVVFVVDDGGLVVVHVAAPLDQLWHLLVQRVVARLLAVRVEGVFAVRNDDSKLFVASLHHLANALCRHSGELDSVLVLEHLLVADELLRFGLSERRFDQRVNCSNRPVEHSNGPNGVVWVFCQV